MNSFTIFNRIRHSAILVVLTGASVFVLHGQQMQYNASVYNDATLSEDLSTIYGVSTLVDNSTGCGHGQYSTTIQAIGPNGLIDSVTVSGFAANLTVATGGVAGTYHMLGTGQFFCSCFYRYVGTGGPEASVVVPCAYVTNFQQDGDGSDTGGGTLHFRYTWGSSTGHSEALAACYVQEKVTYDGGHPFYFPAPFPNFGVDNPSYQPPGPNGAAGAITDDQMIPGTFRKPYNSDHNFTATQIYRFWCPCYQNGNWQTLAGPLNIDRKVYQNPNGTWTFQICKNSVTPVHDGSCAAINPLP